MGSFHVVGTDKFKPIFRVEEIEMVIVPNLFISWLHMTTQNVCLRHSLQRYVLCTNVVTNEVTRGQKVTNF